MLYNEAIRTTRGSSFWGGAWHRIYPAVYVCMKEYERQTKTDQMCVSGGWKSQPLRRVSYIIGLDAHRSQPISHVSHFFSLHTSQSVSNLSLRAPRGIAGREQR
jgi:hypothetical protein